MRVIIEYLLHNTWLRNKKTFFNGLRFSSFLISIVFFSFNITSSINYLFLIASIIFFLIVSKYKKNLYENFNFTKYNNCSKGTFSLYSENERKKFYDTLINTIKHNDLNFDNKKHLKFKKMDTPEFKEYLINDFNYETFSVIISELKSDIWIRDVFTYKKAFIRFIAILNSGLIRNSKEIEHLNLKKTAIIFNNNIQITKKKITLIEIEFKKDLDKIFLPLSTSKEEPKISIKLINHLRGWFSTKSKIHDLESLLHNLCESDFKNYEKGILCSEAKNKIDLSRIFFQLKEFTYLNDQNIQNIYNNQYILHNGKPLNIVDYNADKSRLCGNAKSKSQLFTKKVDLRKFI